MPKLAAPSVSASGPLIARVNGRPQLLVALSDGTTMIGEPDLSRPGAFRSSLKIPGSMPHCWLSPQGGLTVATVTDDSTVLLSHPDQSDDRPATIHLPHPIYRNSATRSGPTLLPFGDGDGMKLFVGLQTGVHTMASALYDAAGKQLWTDEKEGPYPRSAAAAKLGKPDGPYSLVVDNHGKHLLYDMAGKSTLIAHGWYNTIPGRGDGGKYVVPIVGPFGPDGQTRILMTSGLQAIETLDAAGRRLAKWDTPSTYGFEWNGAAVARLRGSAAAWDLAMVTRDGLLYCFDVATCQPRWTYDLHCKATVPINIVSGDVDGNGTDDLLIGLPNGTLVALTERAGKPAELWHVGLDAGIREAILGDVDGDGRSEAIVETEEGSIRVFK
jgi:outer membrane protein assembly factor BamB